MRRLAGFLSYVSLGGLALIASGLLAWGAQGLALFTLLGFIWIFAVVTSLGGERSRNQPG